MHFKTIPVAVAALMLAGMRAERLFAKQVVK